MKYLQFITMNVIIIRYVITISKNCKVFTDVKIRIIFCKGKINFYISIKNVPTLHFIYTSHLLFDEFNVKASKRCLHRVWTLDKVLSESFQWFILSLQ